MKPWTDLFLTLPLPEHWLRIVLFVTFGLHLLFVLLMLGTAMIGLYFFLHAWLLGEPGQQSWNGKVVASHLGLKSLAVVLGVGPLLVIQVYYSEAFFTATGLFGYAWLAVIPLLIVAFLSIDAFGHKLGTRPRAHLLFGVLGLAALLTVPAIFTGALSLMERPDLWSGVGSRGLAADGGHVAHWLFRYLHVLGAAMVFGGAFHLFFSSRNNPERAARLGRWILVAALFQVVVGIPLLASVAAPLSPAALAAVTVGVAAVMALIWGFRAQEPEASQPQGPLSAVRLLVLLPVIFAAMLATRQWVQDGALGGVRAEALSARARQAVLLSAHQPQALAAFKAKLHTVYDNGKTIYEGSCQPCHGENGTGNGATARRLLVPAEDLSALRIDRTYAHKILLLGVPGSAMPYFTVFDRRKLESLLDELDSRFSMLAAPVAKSPVGGEARQAWNTTCATCHGQEGEVSAFGKTLQPAPPDLTRLALEPARGLTIITEGYPGTVMQPYRNLPEQVRTDLAALSGQLRKR